ncbi:PilN domain-containing protein [Pantoea sp. BAV 3049]|uniref:PilN domain-containing protein n=1 Tax=Pantoea sp. BAV 3049 TaxID=2654188 RepID=UPI00131B17BF|nr:PilN domain-containing protein [Pantoea sp. BAV 3049]
MVWVNLLPWRARQLQARMHRWLLVLLVLLAAFLTALLLVAGQQAVNARQQLMVLRQEESSQQINELKTRLAARIRQREVLEQQLATRQQVQQRLEQWVDFSLRLAEQLPDMLWLSELTKTPERLTLTGFCQTMTDVQDFRQRLQQLPLFGQVTTGKLSRRRDGMIHFSLLAILSGAEGTGVVSQTGRPLKGAG